MARAVDGSAIRAHVDSWHHLAVQMPTGVPEHGASRWSDEGMRVLTPSLGPMESFTHRVTVI
jgi:hypothetical protein